MLIFVFLKNPLDVIKLTLGSPGSLVGTQIPRDLINCFCQFSFENNSMLLNRGERETVMNIDQFGRRGYTINFLGGLIS